MSRPEVDVIVVGLGAMGSSALLHLARAGATVLGVEQFTPGHARGSSHGQTRIIRTAYAEGERYVPLARRSWELWDELSTLAGERLVRRTGGLVMGPEGSAPVLAPVVSARAHGLPYEIYDPSALRERFPQHRVDPDTTAFFEEDAGVIRPESSVLAALRVARSFGAEVRTGTAVDQVTADAARPSIRIGTREIAARHIVVAGGAWLRTLVPPVATEISVVRRVVGWFEPRDPEEYAADRFPVFIRSDASGARTWYGLPGLDSPEVKVALHIWPGLDEPVDPRVGARQPDGEDGALLTEIVERTLPGLRPEPVRMQACMYSNTPDHDFLVGGRPDLPGLTILGGFSGHGFKFAPVLGEIARDLALEGRTRWDIAPFALDRF